MGFEVYVAHTQPHRFVHPQTGMDQSRKHGTVTSALG
jgi:hypothetical protein